jgi:probable phosphomutase (TIGR03848 family)
MEPAVMTTFLLIRHALHRLGGDTIAGRLPDVSLSAEGASQAAQLAARVAAVPLEAIYSSPLERTWETAAPLGVATGLDVQRCDAIAEIDFGEWTGRRLDELRGTPHWSRWNAYRSGSRAPGGESMLEVQSRAVGALERLRDAHPIGRVALVSHADVIKAMLAYGLGAPLDLMQRIEISPASVSALVVAEYGPWVLCVNRTDGGIDDLPSGE